MDLVYLLYPSNVDWFIRSDMFARPKTPRLSVSQVQSNISVACFPDPRRLDLAIAKSKLHGLGRQPSPHNMDLGCSLYPKHLDLVLAKSKIHGLRKLAESIVMWI